MAQGIILLSLSCFSWQVLPRLFSLGPLRSILKRVWLRHLIRAVIAAIAFTPTIVPAPEFHGSLPMPAAFLLYSTFLDNDSDWRVNIIYGGIPLLVVALLYWSVASLISFLIRQFPAEE